MWHLTLRPDIYRRLSKIEEWEHVEEVDLGEFDQMNIATHAMNRNLQRDIALFYDNLKPVQRRLLTTMALMGLFYDPKDDTSHMSKAAGVVGDTLKRFHPHGKICPT